MIAVSSSSLSRHLMREIDLSRCRGVGRIKSSILQSSVSMTLDGDSRQSVLVSSVVVDVSSRGRVELNVCDELYIEMNRRSTVDRN